MANETINIKEQLDFFQLLVDSYLSSSSTIYICNNAEWKELRLYAWGDTNDALGVWPGIAPQNDVVEINGKIYQSFDINTQIASKNEHYIVNNNGEGLQLDIYFGVLTKTVFITINKDNTVTIDKNNECRSPLQRQIDFVKTKLTDKKLYLAVVGEFSSGKSTFVNALLRKRILKEAVRPTTACATFIEKGQGDLKIEVSFNKKKFVAVETDFAKLLSYLQGIYKSQIKGFNHIIEILTSEQEVAKQVTDLHLYIPDSNLPDNIVIIDTPGFNPGGDAVSNHYDITRNVVANVADAAIVLMPSGQAFSDTIGSFVSDYLRQYLHRCLFVITRGDDKKSKEERKEILQFTQKHCKEDFGLADARVFLESAITMLPVKKIPDDMRAEWSFWQNEFKSFETFVWNLLSKQNETIISEHLLNLSYVLSQQLREKLNRKQEELQAKKTLLDNSRVAKIQTVTDKLVSDAKSSVSSQVSSIKYDVDSIVSSQRYNVEKVVDRELTIDTIGGLADNIIPKIESEVRSANYNIRTSINSKMHNGLQNSVNTNINKMKDGFNTHYAMFPALSFNSNSMKINVEEVSLPNIDFDIAKKMKESAENEGNNTEDNWGFGGLVAGGVLAFLTGGLAIPLIAGGGILGSIFGNSKKKEIIREAFPKIKSAITKEINTYFNKVSNNYVREIDNQGTKISNTIQSFGDKHVKTYGAKVQSLIDEQETQSRYLENTTNNLNEQIRLLEKREDDIKYYIEYLKTK